jgi:hypothetical protein
MATITLTFTASTEEIVSGVPRLVVISSDVPATIYYTIDGTDPTEDSAVYADAIDFPEGVGSVILSAFAIDSELNTSEIFTTTYATNIIRLERTHITGSEGKVVDRVTDDRDNAIGYDADGDEVAYTDEELYKLRPSYSSQGWQGIEAGTAISVGVPDPEDTPYPFDDDFDPYSTIESSQFFNPYAKVIVMDARQDNEVSILNRPWGSLRNVSREFGGKRLVDAAEDPTYISGGFVKSFYSVENNVMVSYYFDRNTYRYIKSIQEMPATASGIGNWNHSFPLVFRWIQRGRHSSLMI